VEAVARLKQAAMKNFIATVRFSFEGQIEVRAETPSKARENIENHFGMTIGHLHTTLEDEDIPDWDFPIHPDKQIVRIQRTTMKFKTLKDLRHEQRI